MDFLINPIYDTYISCGTFCDECICNNGSCKERHGWDICISDCSKIVGNLFVVEVWHVGLLPDNKYNFQLVLRENAAYSLRQRF